MNKAISIIKSIVFGRLGVTSLLVIAGLVVAGLAVRTANESASAVTCDGAPTQPTLNLYPLTFQSPAEDCHDYPALDARLATETDHYSQSQADLDNGLDANEGDEIYVLSYIHNGATNVGLPDSETTAHDVAISTNVPTSEGTTHTITTSFGGSNTNTVNGNFTIHTPAGMRLEVIPNSGQLRNHKGVVILDSGFDMGNTSPYKIDKHDGAPAGDLRACFEHSVFVRFKVKVVRVPEQLTDNAVCIGAIAITPNPALPGQAFTGTVSVRNTGTTTWTNPGYFLAAQNTTFSPSRINLPQSIPPNGQADFALSGTLPNAPGTYNGGFQMARESGNIVTLFGAICPVTVVVNNNPGPSTTTLQIVKEVRDVTANGNFAHSINSSNGSTVEYRIKVKNVGSVTAVNVIVTDTFASGLVFIPGSTQVVPPVSTGTLSGGGMALGNLAVNAEVTITYRATVNQINNVITNTATADADNANLVQDQANVVVSSIPVVVCVPNFQTVLVNQTASFSATGGTGVFSWTAAPGGNPTTGTGATFTTVYNTPGPRTIMVTSGGVTAFCQLTVNPIPQNQVVCAPDNQTVLVNRPAFFVATGGNGVFSWTAPGGNPSTGASSSFTTSYSTPGTRIVTVASDGLSDTCQVTVVEDDDRELICSPGSQTVDINERVFFSAVGGNGNYRWSAPGGNPSSGDDRDFSTRYNNDGTKTVTVTSGNDSDQCTVRVREDDDDDDDDEDLELDIDKLVRNVTSGSSSFQNSVSANNNDRVEFQIRVKNTGDDTVSNVRLDDDLPNGLTIVDNFNGNLGSLSSGQTRTITFQARVNSSGISSGTCLTNTAGVRGNDVSRITDTATVCVSTVAGENINLQFSKTAFNDTRGSDAQAVTANRGDFITYTLTVHNSGNAAATNFVITDDLSGVLPFADMVDLGGGSLNGNVISFPSVTVPAGGSVSKTFRVRVKTSLQTNLTFVLRNTYGNTVTINVGSVQGEAIFIAPKTGAAGTSAAVFAGLLTSGFVAFRKRRSLLKLIFT